MITVQHITKDFQLSRKQQKEMNLTSSAIRVVDDVSFECRPGRIFALLGPNGAGKTTTLRMIAGILKPVSGTITVCDHDVTREPIAARKKIGFLTGSTGLYDRLTADETVRYFADLYGMPKDTFKARREKLFSLLGIHSFAKKRVAQLSTGMKQKVSIARTMIHDPEVIVFDEPTSGLDVITAENILQLIRDCKEDGKTVIFSSHIMSEVDLLADDLAIIHNGKLIFNDTMQTFRTGMKAESLTKEFIRIIREGGQ